VRGRSDGDEGKATTKQWVLGVSHLDLCDPFFIRVLEGGIELSDRSIISLMKLSYRN
jgi:hypothetical protein